ncbi:hypothetical protein A2V71_01325 [Candidatus Berkelbacteria bacterium RBG_13_40_8]|uniref:Methyltransferase domain-containing protein n=1 Tax=Candidatus Berkelbacteria bacterium RBG_13_40_8 TaxID=1797467 RepID=A0A1F5DMH2_9BACT|nr:MAG: hypothetical protein A2V71_01325 [Candidatus Berkelbacteria bacterium RBG_13_40_8]
MWILIILSIVVLIIFLWQISNLISVFAGSLYVKTDRVIIRKALKLAKVKRGDVFYDLGCGNGDVLTEASKLGAKVTGFEISPYYYLLSKTKIFLFKQFAYKCSSIYNGIDVRLKNILNVDLGKADVVYVYLLPKFLKELAPKFKKELKPKARLISIGFPVKNLRLSKKILLKDRTIFIYL